MKVKVNEYVDRTDIPVIVKHKAHDLLVLKTASSNDDYSTFKGVVLYAGENVTDRSIGAYNEYWDEDQFDPFHGNIILSND